MKLHNIKTYFLLNNSNNRLQYFIIVKCDVGTYVYIIVTYYILLLGISIQAFIIL